MDRHHAALGSLFALVLLVFKNNYSDYYMLSASLEAHDGIGLLWALP